MVLSDRVGMLMLSKYTENGLNWMRSKIIKHPLCLKMQLESEGVKKKNKEEWAKMLKSKRVFNPTNLPPEQINE